MQESGSFPLRRAVVGRLLAVFAIQKFFFPAFKVFWIHESGWTFLVDECQSTWNRAPAEWASVAGKTPLQDGLSGSFESRAFAALLLTILCSAAALLLVPRRRFPRVAMIAACLGCGA